MPGRGTLHCGEYAGRQHDDQQRSQRRGQRAEAAGAATAGAQDPLGGCLGGCQELCLQRVRVTAMSTGPVMGGLQSDAAVQAGLVTALRVPRDRRVCELTVYSPAFSILSQPSAQPGPLDA